MKPIVRRFISTAITRGQRKQQQNISTWLQRAPHLGANFSSTFNQIPSKRHLSSSTTSLIKRLAYYPINSITRLALRALFQIGRQPTSNALLATTSINRALRYSVGLSPSSNHTAISMEATNQAEDKVSDGDRDDDQLASKSSTINDKMAALENHNSGNTLDSLGEAYASCRKKGTNVWLDFADKSCYIYLYRGGGEPNQSLAAFDLDGTLIKPKSNKRIPRSATDWDLFSVWTKIKLQQCLRENHARFVIFTNQNGVGLEIVPLEEVQHRIELVTKRLDIPCTVFMAIEKDIFRKPQTGMFQLFNKSFNDSLPVDFSSSFYCGDAIGYPSHSDADIKFAQQLGFPFLTPEKFLRGVKPKLVT